MQTDGDIARRGVLYSRFYRDKRFYIESAVRPIRAFLKVGSIVIIIISSK